MGSNLLLLFKWSWLGGAVNSGYVDGPAYVAEPVHLLGPTAGTLFSLSLVNLDHGDYHRIMTPS